ncbi:class I adenylate-forming enzyme family protein [Gemmatimonas phototrophica]|nr:AMP-binding protein [Gemmatimonas phototrophica]
MPFPQLPELFDPVAWWARVDGTRTAVVDSATAASISYAQLDADADTWHVVLERLGVQPGDRVGILAQNRYEFLPVFFACIRRGAILVPLNWRLSPAELTRVLANAMPTVVLGEAAYESLAGEARCAAPWVDLDREAAVLLMAARQSTAPPSPVRTHEDTTMLLYTSGSTGAPKGVMLPHRQLLWNALGTSTGWALGSEDVAPAATPFFHTGGWHVFTTPLLFRGGTVVLMGAFDAEEHLEVMARHRLTMSFGVPTQLDMLRQAANWGRPLPALRTFISGGAPCPQRTKDAVRAAGYRFREGYGLTECGPNCFATSDATAMAKDGTVGWPMPFLSMRLHTDAGEPTGAGEVGELQLRGPQMFSGYFNAPDRTAEVLTSDGWLRTGDLASVDADGVYRICGRRKEMFISGGENVFPGEVETALLDCPGVLEATVVGVPDAKWGEVGCAVVVRRDPALGESVLLREARRRLAGYKVPRHLVFTEALPRLGSGKIDRQLVLTMALAAVRERS